MANELLGTIASLFVVGAFALKGERNIRIMDSVGAALFVVYGVLIGSFSNIFLNAVLLGINLYRLVKLNGETKEK